MNEFFQINPDIFERDLGVGVLAFSDRVDEYVSLGIEEHSANYSTSLKYLPDAITHESDDNPIDDAHGLEK